MRFLHQIPPLRTQETLQNKRFKKKPGGMEDTEEMVPSRHNRTETRMNSEAVAGCTGPGQGQVMWGPRGEKGSRHEPSSLTQKRALTDNHSQRKNIIPYILTGYINYT